MYFSQNKKPAERRANDEYRRRMVDAKSAPVEEEVPACILPDQEAPAPDCTPLPGGLPLAMVYSPKQPFENLYEPMEGLSRGTLFSALDLPFQGRSVTRR